jgi:hypothetical protein
VPTEDQKLRIHDLRRRAAALATDLEHVIAWDSAVSMAFEERTGRELRPGEHYTRADAARADEIMLLFPRGGA